MKKTPLVLILSLSAFVSFGFRGKIGEPTVRTMIDSLSFNEPIAGSTTREFHYGPVSLNALSWSIVPVAGYGHNKVRLNYVHLNPEPEDAHNRVNGARDSSAWYFGITGIAFYGTTPDTFTENQNGTGSSIPHIAFTGACSIPNYRVENAWADWPNATRTFGNKEAPTVTRPVVEADSIKFILAKYAFSAEADQQIYYGYGFTSYDKNALGAPSCNRYLHIQYCDTATLYNDFFPFANSQAKDAAIVYAVLDMDGLYTIDTVGNDAIYPNTINAPWGNRNRHDLVFSTHQEENNIYLYRGDRVPVQGVLARAMAATTSTFYMTMPSGWDSATYKTLASYKPAGMIYPSDVVNPNLVTQVLITQPNQATSNIGCDTWAFNGTVNATSSLDSLCATADSVIWRITLNPDGDNPQPDSALAVGGRVFISNWPWMSWEGMEDFEFDGYYGSGGPLQPVNSQWTQALSGYLHGTICNEYLYGIDSLVANATFNDHSAHYTIYRCWPPNHHGTSPLRIREGFQLWHHKSYIASHTDTPDKSYRWQSMVAFYTWN